LPIRVMRSSALTASLLAAVIVAGCRQDSRSADKPAKPIGQPVSIEAPLGLPPVPVPAENPPTRETIALGKKLYFSPALSIDGTVTCASCHDPAQGFADPRPVSIGVRGGRGSRNAPTVLNSAYNKKLFWDGRAASLENQVSGPMTNSLEMGHTLDGVLRDVSRDPELRKMFEAAYGPGPPTIGKISQSIAAFERTLLSGSTPFDRFFYGGQKDALSPSAQRGFAIFRDPNKGDCAACHTVGRDYALFTDHEFHNLGTAVNAGGELADLGLYTQTGREGDQGAFRTPSLRNVARTAPYMHDGSLRSLKDVVDFYVGGGTSNPYLDKRIKPLSLTSGERTDLVAFLESLTGEVPSP
jgi:cytochrome c peroxidase